MLIQQNQYIKLLSCSTIIVNNGDYYDRYSYYYSYYYLLMNYIICYSLLLIDVVIVFRFIRLWDVETGAAAATFTNRKMAYNVKFYPRDNHIFIAACSDNKASADLLFMLTEIISLISNTLNLIV